MANLFKIGDKFETYDEFNNLFQKWCIENFHPVCAYDSHTITDVALKSTVQFKDIYLVFIPVFEQSLAQGKEKSVH